jgi:phosphate butyryltransferase
MTQQEKIEQSVEAVQQALVESGYFDSAALVSDDGFPAARGPTISRLESALKAARDAQHELHEISHFLHDHVVSGILEIERSIRDPHAYHTLRIFMEKLLATVDELKTEPGFVSVYGELLSVYIFILSRCGAEGEESPLIRHILTNITRRKAIEHDRSALGTSIDGLGDKVVTAIIAKRYAVYVVATQGTRVLVRAEIDFISYGNSPESLALQIANVLMKAGIRLSSVTDIVCAGGDVGTLPDGIYVLDVKMRDESRRRLRNSSLNRGALVACELRELLMSQGDAHPINISLANPLSFTTLDTRILGTFLRADARELQKSLHGYVKVTPLKSIAALISEIQCIPQDELNLLVMCLDELFASVVRKTGPRIVRELAAQDANSTLSKFDFDKIVDALKKDGFQIPEHFRLASKSIGTGVKEICELLMIVESGRVSRELELGIREVIDTYARGVAGIIEMASSGPPNRRPHYIVITSMMALDPYFHQLFGMIRGRIDNPFTPVMCLDSLEHEYLIANHLFEVYLNPEPSDKRLTYTSEAASIKHALQVLQAGRSEEVFFSFNSLLDTVESSMSAGELQPGSLVLVGADNEDALQAVANAKEYGLLKRVVLIGDPDDISAAIARTKIALSPGSDTDVEVLATDPLAADFDAKKESMAKVFGKFLHENTDFSVMKGSISTAPLLREALSLYKERDPDEPQAFTTSRRIASHTSLFVLPDGRFFALSDAAVNPSFRSAEFLVAAIENQVDVVRRVVSKDKVLKLAVITAVEKRTSAIPATQLAAEAVEQSQALEERYGPLVVEGPLSFDLATVPEVSEEKHYEGEIRGDANCLVATDINTANVLYKMLSKTMGSLGLLIDSGSVITAGPGTVPIVLTSRGDTSQTKFNSILLSLAYKALK